MVHNQVSQLIFAQEQPGDECSPVCSLRKVSVFASRCKNILGSPIQSIEFSNGSVKSELKFQSFCELGLEVSSRCSRNKGSWSTWPHAAIRWWRKASEDNTMLYSRCGISGSLMILLAAWATFDISQNYGTIIVLTFTAIIDFISIEMASERGNVAQGVREEQAREHSSPGRSCAKMSCLTWLCTRVFGKKNLHLFERKIFWAAITFFWTNIFW